jgi:hypothetical protein
MFSSVYQNGDQGIEIFSASGKSPGHGWKISPTIHRVYDRTVKGFVFLLEKPASASMQIPENIRETLDLTQRYFILQLRYSSNKAFTFEVTTYDQNHQRHRFHISSKFRQIDVKPFHVQIPFAPECEDNCWINFILDLKLLNEKYFHVAYSSINSISIQPCCRIRKVFTIPKLEMYPTFICPTSFDFPSGTITMTQVIPEWVEELLTPPTPVAAALTTPVTVTTEQKQSNRDQFALTESELIEQQEIEMKSALKVLHKKTLGKTRSKSSETKNQSDLDKEILDKTLQEISTNPWKAELPRPKTPLRAAPRSPYHPIESKGDDDLFQLPIPPPSRPGTQQSQNHPAYSDILPPRPSSSSSRPGSSSSRPGTQQSQNRSASSDLPPPPSSSSRPGTQGRRRFPQFLGLTVEQIDEKLPIIQAILSDLEREFLEEYGETEFANLK